MSIALMRSHAVRLARGEQSIAAMFRRARTALLEAMEQQRTRHALARLDDRMLSDIGLSRYEVELELRRAWWRD